MNLPSHQGHILSDSVQPLYCETDITAMVQEEHYAWLTGDRVNSCTVHHVTIIIWECNSTSLPLRTSDSNKVRISVIRGLKCPLPQRYISVALCNGEIKECTFSLLKRAGTLYSYKGYWYYRISKTVEIKWHHCRRSMTGSFSAASFKQAFRHSCPKSPSKRPRKSCLT